jgi:predicted DNA-binding ribbon-helix-helix protein
MRDKRGLGKSRVLKKSVVVDGSNTSVSLEEPFWNGLKEIAAIKKVPIYVVISEIANAEGTVNLSSAIRLFVLNHYRAVWGKLTGLLR